MLWHSALLWGMKDKTTTPPLLCLRLVQPPKRRLCASANERRHTDGNRRSTRSHSRLRGKCLRRSPHRLDMPEATQPVQIDWGYLVNIVADSRAQPAGLRALASSVGRGLLLAFVCHHIHGLLGITLCYHRILTHQGSSFPSGWSTSSRSSASAACKIRPPAGSPSIACTIAIPIAQPDPHSPLVNFFWAHVGWVLVQHREHSRLSFFEQYARDILRDPFYFRAGTQPGVVLGLLAPRRRLFCRRHCSSGRLATGHLGRRLQFGASVLVWGVFVRTVLVWHVTWAVNSVTHIVGYRNYETGDDSRNHWLVGARWPTAKAGTTITTPISGPPPTAIAGGNIDSTCGVIRLLELLGLAKNVVRPRVWRQRLRHEPAD